MLYLLTFLIGYLVGSIPNGLYIGRWLQGIDLREHGSKNIGATNAYRTLGPKPALLVFTADLLKGIIGVYAGQLIVGGAIGGIVGGMAAICGHNWSMFLGFKGGRGVATGLGVIALLSPQVTFIVFTVWLIIVLLTKYVSLGSIVAAACVPVLMWYYGEPTEVLFFGVAAAVFVIVRHRPNIERLLKGEELKIKAGGKKPDQPQS